MNVQAPHAMRPLNLLEVDNYRDTADIAMPSWPDDPMERRQFARVQCAKKAICCPSPYTRIYVLVQNISPSGMAAKVWSDLEPDTSVEIILSPGVILPATVTRITGIGTKRVVAFEFGRLLTETELSSFLTPIWQTENRADLVLTGRCSAVATRVDSAASLHLCPEFLRSGPKKAGLSQG